MGSQGIPEVYLYSFVPLSEETERRWFRCAQPPWGDTVSGCKMHGKKCQAPPNLRAGALEEDLGRNWAGTLFRVRNLPSSLQMVKGLGERL